MNPALQLSEGDHVYEQQLVAYSKTCVQTAFNYFKSKFDDDLKPVLLAFKAARYFSPSKVHEMKPSVTDPDSLSAFTFLNSQVRWSEVRTT